MKRTDLIAELLKIHSLMRENKRSSNRMARVKLTNLTHKIIHEIPVAANGPTDK